MPSQIINRILSDCGVDVQRIKGWYDEGQQKVDALGWSPNESRYWDYVHRFVQRRTMEFGCKKNTQNTLGSHDSRALQALIKSTLSEIEAEKSGVYLD